jgi:hypothetical protein
MMSQRYGGTCRPRNLAICLLGGVCAATALFCTVAASPPDRAATRFGPAERTACDVSHEDSTVSAEPTLLPTPAPQSPPPVPFRPGVVASPGPAGNTGGVISRFCPYLQGTIGPAGGRISRAPRG